jgi:hypothetical protein
MAPFGFGVQLDAASWHGLALLPALRRRPSRAESAR